MRHFPNCSIGRASFQVERRWAVRTVKVEVFDGGSSQTVLPASRQQCRQAWAGFFSGVRTIEESPSYGGTRRPPNMPLVTGDVEGGALRCAPAFEASATN